MLWTVKLDKNTYRVEVLKEKVLQREEIPVAFHYWYENSSRGTLGAMTIASGKSLVYSDETQGPPLTGSVT